MALEVSSSFVSADLISAPGGVDNWAEMIGGLSGAGCSGSGSDYDCVRGAAVEAPLVHPANPADAFYTWVFNIELPTGTLFTGTDQASIKARYVTNSGFKSGALVSENITPSELSSPGSVSTPEPGRSRSSRSGCSWQAG